MRFLALLIASIALATPTKAHVPLEVHIMSQCPDATHCFTTLILPALEQVSSLTNLTISFLGMPATTGGVSCPHGPSECLGDMLHLCGLALFPQSRALRFSRCLLEDYARVTEERFVRACLEEDEGGFEEVNTCVSDVGEDGGLAMLRRSVQRSKDLGVTKSCTVRLEERVWCIRDGGEGCGEGRGVGELVEAVRNAYDGKQWWMEARRMMEGARNVWAEL